MRQLHLLLLIVLLSAVTNAQKGPAKSSASVSIDQERTDVVVYGDGHAEETTTATFQALNDQGRVELATTKVQYNSTLEKVEISNVLIMDDKFIKRVPKSAIVDRPIATKESGISGAHEIVILFEGLQVHSQVKYTIKRRKFKPSIPGVYEADFSYGFTHPELDSTVNIKSEIPLDVHSQDPGKLLEITQSKSGKYQVTTIKNKKPIFIVSKEQIANGAGISELLKAVPRVLVATSGDWDQYGKAVRQIYQRRFSEPLPSEAKAFLATLKSTDLPSNKIAAIREWISSRVTYSGRWISQNSDWLPRTLSEILSTKVADCKDFAFLLVRMAKEVNLDAEIAFVGMTSDSALEHYALEPMNPDIPAPSLHYFNHAITSFKIGNDEFFIDPTTGLSQGAFTDFHLNGKYGWVPFRPNSSLKRILIKNLEQSTVSVSLNPSIVGYDVQAKFLLNGQLAEYFQYLDKGSQKESIGSLLAYLAGFSKPEDIDVKFATPINPKVPKIDVTVNFKDKAQVVDDGKGTLKFKSISVIYPLTLVSFQGANSIPPIDFPFEVKRSVEIPNLFVKDEVKADCLIRGPMVNYDRTVVNEKNRVTVDESMRFAINFATIEKDKESLAVHLRHVMGCLGHQIEMTKRDPADKTQISFEDKISPKIDYSKDSDPTKGSVEDLEKWRKYKFLSKRDPKNPEYPMRMGEAVQAMGMMHSNWWLKEYLDESVEFANKSLALDPKYGLGWRVIAKARYNEKNYPAATAAFAKAYALNPTDFSILSLGAKLAERQKNIPMALGYYKSAYSYARGDSERASSLYDQASLLANDNRKTAEVRSILEQSIKLRPENPWHLYNCSLIYMDLKDYDKVIELNKKALAKMDFSIARSELSTAYSRKAQLVLQSADTPLAKISSAEQLLHEAALVSSDNEMFNFTMAWLNIFKFAELKDSKFEPDIVKHLELAARQGMDVSPLVQAYIAAKGRMKRNERRLAGEVVQKNERMIASATIIKNEKYPPQLHRFEADQKAPGGGEYGMSTALSLSPVINGITSTCSHANSEFFDAIVEIDAKGAITSWESDHRSVLDECIKRQLIGKKVKPPPFGSFHVRVTFSIGPGS